MKRTNIATHRGSPPVRRTAAQWIAPFLIVGVLMLAVSCSQSVGSSSSDGSVTIAIGELDAASVYGDQNLQPTSYIFSGTGPNGATFSLISDDTSTTVQSLTAGEWRISVEGVNDQDEVVLAGETVIEVQAFSDTEIELVLEPVTGVGTLRVAAEWNSEHTIEPSSRVTLTNGSGESDHWTLSASGGRTEHTIEDLPTGFYRVAIQLFDQDEEVSGSAHTVRVANGSVVEVFVEFNALNKVGKPIQIVDESFTIGWDEPDSGRPDLYRVYARERGEYHWDLIDEMAAGSSPRYTVSAEALEYGVYEFAVSSIADGQESALHSSMADDAQPGTGWHIEWLGP